MENIMKRPVHYVTCFDFNCKYMIRQYKNIHKKITYIKQDSCD